MFKSKESQFAIDAVRRAAQLVRQVQQEMVTAALTKEDRSPVTVADFAAQALVGYLLGEYFPDDFLVGEESSAALQTDEQRPALQWVTEFVARAVPGISERGVCEAIDRGSAESGLRYWTVDPVDGTKGFLRGEQYAVAFGLVEDGRVQLGVLGCPNLTDGYHVDIGGEGSLIAAVAGGGAWTQPLSGGAWKPLKASERDNPANIRVLRSVESGHTNVGKTGELVEALGITAEPVLMDSQAKYGVLSAGAGDLLVRMISASRPDYKEKVWDQVAGSIVIEEAGGRVTDLDGKPLDFTRGRTLVDNRGILATNGRVHDVALEALRKIGA